MWKVKPKGPPYRILRSGIPLEIEIRPAPPISIVVLAALFTPLWLVGGLVVTYMLQQQDAPRWFLAFWLLAWLLGGGFNLTVLWWTILGREHLIWSRTGLVRKLRLGPFSPRWRYQASHIRNLRVEVGPPLWRQRGGKAVLIPRIAFDYGGQVVYIGLGLTEQAAREIVQRVLRTFPEFGASPRQLWT